MTTGSSLQSTAVLIGDVPLVAGSPFEWRFTAGVAPFTTRVVVPLSAHARLLEMMSPTSLAVRTAAPEAARFVEANGISGNQARELTINHVVLLEWSRHSAFEVSWTLGDVRARWLRRRGGLLVAGRRFNWPTERGDDEAPVDAAPSLAEHTGALASAEPGFPARRYETSTLEPATDRPWTALRLAEHLLERIAVDDELAGRVHGLADNGVIPERVELGESPHDMLRLIEGLLADAEASLFVGADGKAVLLPADESPAAYLPEDAPLADGSAGLSYTDAASLRPSEVRVTFPREQQRTFRFAAGEDVSNAAGMNETGPIDLINVLRLPAGDDLDDADAEFGGAWVPLGEALAAWGLDEATVCEHYFAGRLEALLLEQSGGDHESGEDYSTALRRAASIRAHYRRTFALPRQLLRSLDTFRAVRLDRLDPDTGYATQSVAFAPACLVPAQRPADELLQEEQDSDALHAGVNVPAGPVGTVDVLDDAAGVLRVEFDAGFSGAARHGLGAGLAVLPGHVEELPPPYLRNGSGWHRARLSLDFTLAFALTLRYAEPQEKREATLYVDAEQAGASGFRSPKGPPALITEPHEPLRHVVEPTPEEAAATSTSGGSQSTVPGASVEAGNERLVERKANWHARRIMRATRPRHTGGVRYEGLAPIPVFGSARTIRYQVDANGRVTTEVTLQD